MRSRKEGTNHHNSMQKNKRRCKRKGAPRQEWGPSARARQAGHIGEEHRGQDGKYMITDAQPRVMGTGAILGEISVWESDV